MPENRIQLHPTREGLAQPSRMPARQSQRWYSPFDDRGENLPLQIFVTHQAYVRFSAHAGSDLRHEIGGGLVGEWRTDRDTDASFIIIEAVIPARFTRQGRAFLTFTQDTLVAMNDELEDRYPEKVLVGWYHTHPRMGIFLSSFDVWLHQHFFPEPWQVALVIEPHMPIGGFFVPQETGRLETHRYHGFHELIENGSSSVVHWKNLHLGETFDSDHGEANDE